MISCVLFMCITNTISISSSTMNNSSSSSNNNDNSNDTNKNTDAILDIIFDYTGNGDDELTLRRGSRLEVLSKDESVSGSRGWWTGRLVDSESIGIFPANFVANSQPSLRIIDYNDLQIGDTIGVGGFGHVFYGKFGDVDVAIKTAKSLASFCLMQTTTNRITDDDTPDTVQKTLIDSLLREARLFSNLKHRNIIQLFGVSPSLPTKNLYLVMEYAHGGALSNLLQRRQSGLYPHVFIQYAKQIADGMKYLHEEACEHIIHRDLKCFNILILEPISDIYNDSDLLQKTLKITDFGLARKQLQSSSMSAAGTFAWMSPECIRNSEFSTKSDVWSFGVLLWECLTGELPYKNFDQMQVAFGIATNKYSLPIPSTCPEEFSQLMKNCWKILPQERPTFIELFEQINTIIETNYANNEINDMELNEESYQSLQKDWRQEIQDMFHELKEKEKEIRDREEAMIQCSLKQNHERLELKKWEQQLHERELHIVECELKLLMATTNKERTHHHQTPKIQKRSGLFMRAFLNGNTSVSPTTNTVISSPTNFRHLISVCHNHPTIEQSSSPTIPHFSTPSSPISCPSIDTISANSSMKIFSNSPNKPSNSHYSSSYSSNSTPTTPNMSRLRTLTSIGDLIITEHDNGEFLPSNDVHFPVDGYNPTTPPEKPPRSPNLIKTSGQRMDSHKSKSSSSTIKRKHGKKNIGNGEAKWYLETLSSVNTNNNNNNDNNTTISTPILDRPTRKLVSENSDELSSSSSSSCSTPNDRSLTRALFDVNSILTAIGLGRRIPAQLNSPFTTNNTPSSHSNVLRSASETVSKSRSSSSTVKKSYKRTSSSPTTDHSEETTAHVNIGYRPRPGYSPARPNSLILSSSRIDSENSSSQQNKMTNTSEDDDQTTDDDNEKYYSAQSSKISTPMVQSYMRNSQQQLILPSILDADSEEQKKHKAKVLSAQIDHKNVLQKDLFP